MFLPTTQKEMHALGWKSLDIILVTGDAYIDSPYMGISLIGKWLLKQGYTVGVIAQPDIDTEADITRLGEPNLYWGVSSGAIDSMVANYTALNKPRRSDDYTPGGENNRRPDRACMVYTNLIRRFFKNTAPIILGGLEASLRRIAHYDYKTDKIRRSILLDAKADGIIYGMGERTSAELANKIKNGEDWKNIRGISYLVSQLPDEIAENYIEIPSYEDVSADNNAFIQMFKLFYDNNTPRTAKGLYQKHGMRYVIQNPPAEYLDGKELDEVHGLDFERNAHPNELKKGTIKALDTIRFSITTHRGCYGECSFCAIAVHQGRTIRSRSEESILNEVKEFTKNKDFKGIISDVGGPTANMYGSGCSKHQKHSPCRKKRCLFPKTCGDVSPDHKRQIKLLNNIRKMDGVKKVFVASGIRPDLIVADKKSGEQYIETITKHHVSGQLKLAPEHTEKVVLDAMGKPGIDSLLQFKKSFDKINKKEGKKQFLTYYLIAAHPGCSENEMVKLKSTISKELNAHPEQVQIFTPTPGTWASVMYHTGINPFTGEKIFVEKNHSGKEKQKQIIIDSGSYRDDFKPQHKKNKRK